MQKEFCYSTTIVFLSEIEIEKKVEALFAVMVSRAFDDRKMLAAELNEAGGQSEQLVRADNSKNSFIRNLGRDAGGLDVEKSTGRVADKGHQIIIFKKIFYSLSARMQQIVFSYYIEKKSVKEIAREIGCSISTARVDLHKGRHRLGRS